MPAMVAFLRSREGTGWILTLVFTAALSAVVANGFYQESLTSFVVNKTQEQATARRLIDAFVTNYSNLRRELGADRAPAPATFRAQAIELFNQTHGAGNALRLRWKEGRERPEMGEAVESVAAETETMAPSSLLIKAGGELIYRTLYPSIDREPSDKLQPIHSRKSIISEFTFDTPLGKFFQKLRMECAAIAVFIFLLIGSVGLCISLAHYRHMADREVAKQAAEAANRAKSAFLATMSHELRTPLNAIIGFSEIIQTTSHSDSVIPGYAKSIHQSGAHLLAMLNGMLDLTRIEAGKLALNEDVFDLREVIQSVSKSMNASILEADLTEKVELSEDLPPVRADELRTKQVLRNVMSNAIKFTPKGGRIEIAARCNREVGLILTVADTGVGISPKDLARVLTIFEQVDSSLTRQHQGVGFGLPLAKALMELQGGSLELQSTIGVGTQVSIAFPPERVAFDEVAELTRTDPSWPPGKSAGETPSTLSNLIAFR